MASSEGSAELEVCAKSWKDLRLAAGQFSRILVRELRDHTRVRGSDPVELYRLGKVALESIRFRRSLLERRRGPKWSEENELRRMERQVWKIISSLEKKSGNGQSELSTFSKELKQIMETQRNASKNARGH